MAVAKKLVRQLKGEILFVPKDAKNLYHLTCVLASNYPVALIGAMESIAGKFTRKKLQPFERLVKTSVENALRLGARKALTGPIVRGDSLLVSEHLNAIHDPGLRTLYKSLGTYALRLAAEEGRLTNDQIVTLQKLLAIKE
jgi:predicted short-subunit dehydrogenase-like oxidoreductase (DUF2520 family)